MIKINTTITERDGVVMVDFEGGGAATQLEAIVGNRLMQLLHDFAVPGAESKIVLDSRTTKVEGN